MFYYSKTSVTVQLSMHAVEFIANVFSFSDTEYDHLDYTRPVTTAKPHYQKPYPFQQSNDYVIPKSDEEDKTSEA